jgi:hypothetical protein
MPKKFFEHTNYYRMCLETFFKLAIRKMCQEAVEFRGFFDLYPHDYRPARRLIILPVTTETVLPVPPPATRIDFRWTFGQSVGKLSYESPQPVLVQKTSRKRKCRQTILPSYFKQTKPRNCGHGRMQFKTIQSSTDPQRWPDLDELIAKRMKKMRRRSCSDCKNDVPPPRVPAKFAVHNLKSDASGTEVPLPTKLIGYYPTALRPFPYRPLPSILRKRKLREPKHPMTQVAKPEGSKLQPQPQPRQSLIGLDFDDWHSVKAALDSADGPVVVIHPKSKIKLALSYDDNNRVYAADCARYAICIDQLRRAFLHDMDADFKPHHDPSRQTCPLMLDANGFESAIVSLESGKRVAVISNHNTRTEIVIERHEKTILLVDKYTRLPVVKCDDCERWYFLHP